MIGSKRKSEDVHASTGKKERAASGEPAKIGGGEGGKTAQQISSAPSNTKANAAAITEMKREEKKATINPTKRRKSKQSTDFFNELPSLMGLEVLPTISRQNSFSHIYNNGGEIPQVLSNNNLFATEEVVPPASLVAAPPPQSALKEEGGNAVYNADNIAKATNTTNVVNTASANANNLWESLDLPIPMHPTSMANNNYSVHEQEIILGSKSFTLGTPYTQQHELIRENVNTTTTVATTMTTTNKKAKANVAKNAVGGKQMPSKAQQQKNRRQAVKAKKDAILAIDKIMADNAKNISPPRNLVNNDAKLRTTEVQEANGQYQYFHMQQEQSMQKRNDRMTTTATNTTRSEEENAHPASNGSHEDENNKKSDNNRSSDNNSNGTSLVKEVGNSADGAANIDNKIINNKNIQQHQRSSQAELILLEEFQTVIRNLYSVTRENIKSSLYRLAEEAKNKNRAAGATVFKDKDHVMVDQSVVNLLYQRY